MNRKRPQQPTNVRVATMWGLLMAVFIVELFFYTWCRVQSVNLGYAINQANDRGRELVTLQNDLKIELERLKSPERIARIAETHIGLVKPSPEQMVIIR
jgi:hypothetical protein